MKGRIILLLSITFLIKNLSGQMTYQFNHEGTTRSYILYTPQNLPDDAPLVFVLHGYTSGANVIMAYCEMNQVADLNGFAVCYPQGLPDFFSVPHWNANLTISTVNDIGFLASLAAYLQTEYHLDKNRTFACGMSNGGFMSYTLACERPDVFKAIASVTGTMSGYDWNNCDPSEVVPVMQVSGSADNTVPINGTITTFGGWGGAPGMEAVRDFWVAKNECQSDNTLVIDSNFSTEYTVYSEGMNDQEVWHYLIDDWGHSWPRSDSGTGFAASTEIWNFFSKVTGETTGNYDLELPSVYNIFPNPANQFVTIEGHAESDTHMVMYTMQGIKMMEQNFDGSQKIDVSALPSGMYLVKLNDKGYRLSVLNN